MKRSLYYLFFICLLVNLCHSCLNFTHHNVTFNATNFKYVLQWNKDHLPSDVLFSVQYKRYGKIGWSVFHECQNITETSCDLTSVITGDVEDFMEHQYFGRVRASLGNCSSDWTNSNRLNPQEDTFLILPKVNYIEHVSSVTILVATPILALSSRNKSVTVEDLYRDQSFEYHLSLYNTNKHDKWQKPQKDKRFEVSGLSPNTEYNGSVYIIIGHKRKSDIQTFVVKTLPDHSLVTLIVSLIAIFAVVLGIAMIYMSYKYVRHQPKTPSSLDIKKVTRIQTVNQTERKEKYSPLEISVSSPSVTQYWRQSGNAQLKDVSQFQSSGNKDSLLVSQVFFNLQQNNRTTDSVIYGVLDSDIENQSNHTQNNINTKLELQATAYQQPLEKDRGPFNWLENIGGPFPMSLLIPKPNTNENASLQLLSSVVVSDPSEVTGQEEHTETPLLVSLSDIISPELPNDTTENNAMENSLLQHDINRYRLQYPVDNSQMSFSNETFISEQPYRLQY